MSADLSNKYPDYLPPHAFRSVEVVPGATFDWNGYIGGELDRPLVLLDATVKESLVALSVFKNFTLETLKVRGGDYKIQIVNTLSNRICFCRDEPATSSMIYTAKLGSTIIWSSRLSETITLYDVRRGSVEILSKEIDTKVILDKGGIHYIDGFGQLVFIKC